MKLFLSLITFIFYINVSAQVTISVNDPSVPEGNSGTTSFAFLVKLSAPAPGPISVNYSTANGSATSGSDYVSVSGTLQFNTGEIEKPVNVFVNGDLMFEANETFFINLSNSIGAAIGDGQGIGTIINDDGSPSLSINDISIIEGNSGTKFLNFTISLSAASGVNTTVSYATLNNTAIGNATPGIGDYTMKNDVVVLNAGTTSLIVDVPINGDLDIETDEQFYVDLNNSINASISKGRGVGTILNDDYPILTINDVSLIEGNSGTSSMNFTVTLTPAVSFMVTVNFFTSDGSAAAGSDYTNTSGSLTFSPGETTKNISVNINGDVDVESDETFTVNLSSPTNAKFGDNSGTGTILNDDLNTGTISNFVWKDIDGDGIQDGSEPGFANIQVNLLDGSTGSSLSSTTTDVNGYYAFASVPSGTYKVAVTAPSGWGFTSKDIGGSDAVDSDVDPATSFTDPFTLAAGVIDDTRDAGLVSANTTTTKTGPSTATVGENITYRIAVHNNGPTAASGVVVSDPLPQGTTYVSSTGNGEFVNGVVRWNPGTIQYNEDSFFDVTVEVTTSGDVTNTSTTTSTTPDPFPNDNIPSITTHVQSGSPVAVMSANPNPAACSQVVTFDGTASYQTSTSHSIVTYQWDFDYDGTTFNIDAVGATTTHTYSSFGSYTAALRVTDDLGQTDKATLTVNVNQGNHPPVAAPGGPYLTTLGSSITLDGSPSYDPDASCGDMIVTYEWFIDGVSSAVGSTPTISAASINALGVGIHTVSLRVIDTFGLIGSALTTLEILQNTGSISNFVWKDLNGNGIQDGSEPGFANIQVNLLDASTASVLGTTTTDANGLYVFTNVPSGSYKVEVIPPSGWGFTIKDNGSNDVIDSDVNMSTGFTDSFTLAAGVIDDTRDAGLVSANTTSTKTGPSTSTVGEQIKYTIKVHNNGPTAAIGVVVSDPLPNGTTYVASTGNGEYQNGTVTWNLGTMQNDADVSVSVTVNVTNSGNITNTSTTTADTPDPNPNDNSSSTTINVT
ncbi:MAG: DUF11 domain-containing protein, partial [Ignavibacteriales bacterium]|nr:DUF11 domain-containing protein [Ignavibacteriales bacterium]